MTPARPRRFSMLRDFQLADFFTLGNGFAGMGAILLAMKYIRTHERGYITAVFVLLPVALALDFLDGRIARWRRKVSMLGQELDSLADLVSFGVAPAALGFALGLDGAWDGAILLYFVGCGISRLARYNATAASLSDEAGKVRHYEGTPIPTSLGLVILLGIMVTKDAIHGDLPLGEITLGPGVFHPVTLMYFVSGSAMISKTLRIPKP
jgi:CDP-diacylglycerol--serine O-phosphatidyltransferase